MRMHHALELHVLGLRLDRLGAGLRRSACLALACALSGALLAAQVPAHRPAKLARFTCDEASRVADPKLQDGAARFVFHLEPSGAHAQAVAEVRANGARVATLWSGNLLGGAAPTSVLWDGRDLNGARVPTASGFVRLSF